VRVDLHYYGGVPMTDAGNSGPVPTDRRYGNEDVVAGYANLVHWAQTADRLGYDTMWLTEHHFRYEGYEVTPNIIQFGQHLTGVTTRLKSGQMFNVVPQWHPLRLAEDYAWPTCSPAAGCASAWAAAPSRARRRRWAR
jgi:alkanesulfonate monooxygenase SsuD/methylene tetrahydromethanopterin reductase-like flavin-dependent oxidoreductase (luciferase family)